MDATNFDQLRRALAQPYTELYLTNAWFKKSLDELAQFTGVLVDGLALRAEKENQEFQTQIRDAKAALKLLASRSIAPDALNGGQG